MSTNTVEIDFRFSLIYYKLYTLNYEYANLIKMKARRIHKHRLYGALHYGTRVLLKTSKLFKDFINVSVTASHIEDHSGETAVLIEIWNPTIHDAEQYMEILIFLYIVIYYCFPYSVSYGGSCVRN